LAATSYFTRRTMAVLLTAMGTGIIAGLWALYLMHSRLPANDEAAQVAYLSFISDPFVLTIVGAVGIPASTLGFLAAMWLLWGTRLRTTLPIVSGATILSSSAIGYVGLIGVLPTITASIGAMLWCRARLSQGESR